MATGKPSEEFKTEGQKALERVKAGEMTEEIAAWMNRMERGAPYITMHDCRSDTVVAYVRHILAHNEQLAQECRDLQDKVVDMRDEIHTLTRRLSHRKPVVLVPAPLPVSTVTV